MSELSRPAVSASLRPMQVERVDHSVYAGVYWLFLAQVVSLTLLQKLGLPMGGGKVLAIQWPIIMMCLAARYLRHRVLEIDPRRLLAYVFFCVFAILSQTLSMQSFSFSAMLLLLGLYFPATVRIEVDRKTYLRCMNAFQMTLMVVALIVVAQQIMQRLWGHHTWPNMNNLMPEPLLIPNFNYMREMGYRFGQFQPNAIFFLEPSFVSQFLAFAIVVELVFFERLWLLALFTIALFLVFAGTGLLVLGAAAPFLLARLSPKLLIAGIVVGVLVAIVGTGAGWFDQFITRLAEINQPGTSGYYRFTVPWNNLVHSLSNPESSLFGTGAGNTSEDTLVVPIPINKLIDEYGLLTMLAFFAFFTYSLFESAPSKIVAWAMFVCFNVCGGSLALPVCAVVYVVLCTLLRIEPEPKPDAQSTIRARTTAPPIAAAWSSGASNSASS